MSLSVGIVGLPNSGKSTLFNALLRRQIAQVGEYPYTTIEPNFGVVEVPDKRLDQLAAVLKIPKKVPAAVKFIDIAGLIRGAHQGEGLGNQFLGHIREVDAILHVVRAFDPSTASGQVIPHVMGEVNPVRDIEVVNLELEMAQIKKPTVYVLNVDEKQISLESTVFSLQQEVRSVASSQSTVIPICAKLEAELSEISEEEQKQYLTELGVKESGLDQVIKEAYKLLDLITFFTVAGGRQVQAWPLRRSETALTASSLVHSDFARGFITAEVISWDKLLEAARPLTPEGVADDGRGSWVAAREKGLIKIAGRDELVEDGEVIEFKFHL